MFLLFLETRWIFSDSLLAASLKRQIKQPQETSEFVLVDAAYICCNGVERNTRQGELKSKTPEGGFYSSVLKGVGGDAVRACGSVLYRIQVRVSPCGARGGAGRSHTAVWNGRKRES